MICDEVKLGARVRVLQQLYLGRWTVPGETGTVIEPKMKHNSYGLWVRLDKDGLECFFAFAEFEEMKGALI